MFRRNSTAIDASNTAFNCVRTGCWFFLGARGFCVVFNVADNFYGILLINLQIALNPVCRAHTAFMACVCVWVCANGKYRALEQCYTCTLNHKITL